MNEWSFFVQMVGKCEWSFFVQWKQSWQVWVSFRGKTKMAESKMARIQDGCHHQVEWEWISLSQIELVWVRVRVEWECFWVNLREENKVSESNMAELQDDCHHQVESEWMSEVFFSKWLGGKCEWSLFCANGGNQSWQVWVSLRGKTKVAESKMAKFKMAAIIKLSENEWVWVLIE